MERAPCSGLPMGATGALACAARITSHRNSRWPAQISRMGCPIPVSASCSSCRDLPAEMTKSLSRSKLLSLEQPSSRPSAI
jgi:hypothetical protein